MNKRDRKEKLERRREHIRTQKRRLKEMLVETGGDEKLMEGCGYLPTGKPGKWRRMTKNELRRFSEAERA